MMEINIVRLQHGRPARELLDTMLLLGVEFVLDAGCHITVIEKDGGLYVSSSAGRLRILPKTANAIIVEVTE